MKNFNKGLVAIGASNFEEVVAFYKMLFNVQPVNSIGQSYIEFEIAGLRIGIFKPKENNLEKFENKGRDGHGLSICFEVKDLDDLIAGCHASGLAISQPVTTKHGREAFLYDPQDNRLIFSQVQAGD